MGLKLCIALNTHGTNDVLFFYKFGRALAEHGLEWTYANHPLFNHPPLVSYWLQSLYKLSQLPALQENGIGFAFLLRLPGIIADFVVVVLMLRLRPLLPLPTWGLLLLALSPVSLMVSGFHGNTDPVLVLCIVAAAFFCVLDRPVFSGIALAVGCGIKVVPLLLLPLLFCFWFTRRRAPHFTIAFGLTLLALSIHPLLNFPLLFAKNVLAYGSYWGIWGVTYWLRLTQWSGFVTMGHTDLPLPEMLAMNALKLTIVVTVLTIAWRNRHADHRRLFTAIGWSWLVFFIFAPGVGGQYLVWLMPFVLVMSPVAFAYVTLASTCFLFFFYNAITGGLPWDLGVSTDRIADQWVPWSVWPWLAFVAALANEWRKAREHNPSLRLLSWQTTTHRNH
jgi:uncharacterized membrane protein